MRRCLLVFLMLCGFCFSSFASGIEWEVKRGDTIWKILEEGCRVAPSMEKARVFARAIGIRTPDQILIGTRIDVSRGCATLSGVLPASFERVVALSVQQGEVLRAMQGRIMMLEAETVKLRSDYDAVSKRMDAAHQAVFVAHVKPQGSAEMAQKPSSGTEAVVSQGTGAKGYHKYGDPVFFFWGWVILVVGICFFMMSSTLWKLWKRGGGGIVLSDGGDAMAATSLTALPYGASPREGNSLVGNRNLCPLKYRTVDIPL